MDYIRSQISVEIATRQNIEVEVTSRQNIETEIKPRLELTADITTRQEIEAIIQTRAVEDGFLAAVEDETLYLLKDINVNGSELVLNG